MGKTDTGKDDRTPLMVVDLDGTLVSVNTFTLFTKWLVRHLYHDSGFIPLMGLCRDVLLRKCRLIPHSEVKRRILRIAANNCKESDFRKFAESLKSCLRPEVMTLIKDLMQEGGTVVLATATTAVYALPFAGILGIPYCGLPNTPVHPLPPNQILRNVGVLSRGCVWRDLHAIGICV